MADPGFGEGGGYMKETLKTDSSRGNDKEFTVLCRRIPYPDVCANPSMRLTNLFYSLYHAGMSKT